MLNVKFFNLKSLYCISVNRATFSSFTFQQECNLISDYFSQFLNKVQKIVYLLSVIAIKFERIAPITHRSQISIQIFNDNVIQNSYLLNFAYIFKRVVYVIWRFSSQLSFNDDLVLSSINHTSIEILRQSVCFM